MIKSQILIENNNDKPSKDWYLTNPTQISIRQKYREYYLSLKGDYPYIGTN